MTIQDRIQLCMLLESMKTNKEFAKKAGLKDKTHFKSDTRKVLKNWEVC